MFETSRDILNWVLAVSTGVLAFFICWSLYYFIASAQRIYRLVKQVERSVAKAESLIDLAKEKVSGSASYFVILAELLKKGMEYARERRERKKEKDVEVGEDEKLVIKKKKKK
ncbi:MAG: hypothetical protein ACM3PZ_01170 [Bacillota bacterium]